MKGRNVPNVLLRSDQPDLPNDAQLELVRDKEYFVLHPTCKMFNRPFVKGEALPWKTKEGATVDVYAYGARLIIVDDVPVLLIKDDTHAAATTEG